MQVIAIAGVAMPAFKHRAVMLDPARTMERKTLYDWYLPRLRDWGYNVLHLHFADDQGLRVELPSHPQLTSDEAWSADEMRQFIQRAKEHGLEVIPEIECFGHTRFITGHPDFAELGAAPESGFNAIDPEHPGTRDILAELLRDVSTIFDSKTIHVGLDEVNLRALPRYKDVADDQLHDIWAEHMGWVHQAVRDLGRRPAMWGDHLLHSERITERCGRDVLIFDWHYEQEPTPRTMDYFLDREFEVWGCPATMCWYARTATNRNNLSNLRFFAAEAYTRRRKGVTGMVNTVWCPWRFLPGALDWPIALAGYLFSESAENPDYAAAYAQDLYGLGQRDAVAAGEAINRLHQAAPMNWLYDAIVNGESMPHKFNREHARLAGELKREMAVVAGILHPLVRKAKRNGDRLNDVVLTARVLEQVGAFGEAGRKKKAAPDASELMDQIAARWDETRLSPWKTGEKHFASTDKLLPTFKRVA